MRDNLNQTLVNKRLSRSEPTMIGSSRVVRIRRPYRKPAPEWTKDDAKIRELLLRVFPKLHTHSSQRVRAAKWAAIIKMYYGSGMTETDIAQELGGTPDYIRSMRRNILRAGAGLDVKGRVRKKKSRHLPPIL